MLDYLPITLSSLRSDTIINCNVYLLASVNGASRYILYCKGDTAFENEKRELLVRKNINRLFISRDERQKYFEYLESNFQNIMSDEKIPPIERAQIVHNAAANMVKDVFENPRAGNIERAKRFAYNMVDYVLKDGRASFSLLKIAKHEYYTYAHSVNVAAIGTLFAKNLGLGENVLRQLCMGTLLHDLGKTKINPAILNKNGSLTEEEFEEVKGHPESGVKILKEMGSGFKDEYIIMLQHHENCDGTGYPYGLKKDEIHSAGRIARIIDIYDALTTKRPYSYAQTPYDAVKTIKDMMLDVVDRALFKQFIRFLGGYG
jgi:HD-GYP domain-containing protein (c-di-GMP phosphodiesterase class II)